MENSNEDRKLLVRVAGGDELAFRKLYADWQPRLSTFIFQITKSKEITAEIVQDVFLKIWMTRENLEQVDNFKAYLFVVSRNQALNAFRKAVNEWRRFETVNDMSQMEPKANAEAEDPYLSLIDAAIDQLSSRQKEVYLLHRHQKLSYQEIADQLGIGKESVKTHIELAVKSIKRYLSTRVTLLSIIVKEISENS